MNRIITIKVSENEQLSKKDVQDNRSMITNLLKDGFYYDKNMYDNMFEKEDK